MLIKNFVLLKLTYDNESHYLQDAGTTVRTIFFLMNDSLNSMATVEEAIEVAEDLKRML